MDRWKGSDPLRVLLVEDEPDLREILGMVVRGLGHSVEQAADAHEALRRMLDGRPDLALVDIGLPDSDGFALARRFRATEAGRNCFLVAFTGWGTAGDRNKARAAGFDDHVLKPLSRERLAQIFDDARRRR